MDGMHVCRMGSLYMRRGCDVDGLRRGGRSVHTGDTSGTGGEMLIAACVIVQAIYAGGWKAHGWNAHLRMCKSEFMPAEPAVREPSYARRFCAKATGGERVEVPWIRGWSARRVARWICAGRERGTGACSAGARSVNIRLRLERAPLAFVPQGLL